VLFSVAVLGVGFKVVPAYIEFYSVKSVLATMNNDPELKNMDNQSIRLSFAKRANIDYITVVDYKDLKIERVGGVPKVSVAYEFRTKLIGHASLVIDFFASTDPDAQPALVE
jgi:hypothetical protein